MFIPKVAIMGTWGCVIVAALASAHLISQARDSHPLNTSGGEWAKTRAAKKHIIEVDQRMVYFSGLANVSDGVFQKNNKRKIADLGAEVLLKMAVLKAEKNDFDVAIQLTQDALSKIRRVNGPQSNCHLPLVTHFLGFLHYAKGDYANAEKYYLQADELRPASFRFYGLEYADIGDLSTVDIWMHLGMLYQAKGDIKRALKYYAVGSEIEESFINGGGVIGGALESIGEEVRLRWVKSFSPDMEKVISFHLQSTLDDREASRLAAITAIRRKGLVLNSFIAQRRLWDLLKDDFMASEMVKAVKIQVDIDTAQLKWCSDPEAQIARVRKRKELLKRVVDTVATRLKISHFSWKPESLDDVQKAIPQNTALVEFVLYRPFNSRATINSRKWEEPHYAAYVIRHDNLPQGIDLGPANDVDIALRSLLRRMDSGVIDVRQDAAALYKSIFQKIQPLLKGISTVFISPDGQLNLLPFGALVGEDNRYLVEHYLFIYLTSGRDLLYLSEARDGSVAQLSSPIVLAHPAFNDVVKSDHQESEDCRNKLPNGFNVRFNLTDIENTKEEADQLRSLLREALILTDSQATESALDKMTAAPSILHLSTHGFFLPGSQATNIPDYSAEYRRPLEDVGLPGLSLIQGSANIEPNLDDILIRSGLALAGANRRKSTNGYDGILTACEISGLNLWGTKLVVLSACESGKGGVINGEGVFGLRRAIMLSGAESQVISLWNIYPSTGKDLIIDYYKRLKSGEGRAVALREAQLAMLRGQDINHRHPYYWAPFIQSGAWNALPTNIFSQSKN